MTEDQRVEWIEVARVTLGHLPADLLAMGCLEARKHADHPAKIVPTIIRATERLMEMRRESERYRTTPRERWIEPKYVEPSEAAKILEAHGLPVPEVLRAKERDAGNFYLKDRA